MRHFSKIIIEIPDSPSDPPEAVIHIDCDVCGESELRVHMSHLGTVARTIDQTIGALYHDGTTEKLTAHEMFIPSTTANKRKLRDFLDRAFPQWKADRLLKR